MLAAGRAWAVRAGPRTSSESGAGGLAREGKYPATGRELARLGTDCGSSVQSPEETAGRDMQSSSQGAGSVSERPRRPNRKRGLTTNKSRRSVTNGAGSAVLQVRGQVGVLP